MKTFLSILFVLAVILAAYPFLNPSDDQETLTGLPWQIDVMPDGSTQVFGLHIGVSRLADAMATLGNDMELAVIAATDEAGNLEMYYGHYRTGLLSGKLVLRSDATAEDVRRWRDNAVREEYMASGYAKKYFLARADLTQALAGAITGVTFIPSVNLDEALVLARFGEPEKRVPGDAVTHYLYPEKGLDISIYAEAKDVLQYVSPRAFGQLTRPLLQQ